MLLNSNTLNHGAIFNRLKTFEPKRLYYPEYPKVQEVIDRTTKRSANLDSFLRIDYIRKRLSDIIGVELVRSTIISNSFYVNSNLFTKICKHVFAKADCSFLGRVGINVKGHSLIGPKLSLIIESHPGDSGNRKVLTAAEVSKDVCPNNVSSIPSKTFKTI